MAASARCVVEEDIDYFAECRIVRPDGAVRYVLSRAVVMRDDDGTPYRITGICMDVTERRESEDVLRRAKEDAELANRAKTEFLAAVSHELRTPLNAIIGFSETMNHAIFGPLGNATYEEYAEGILQSGRHLLGVINDILDVSRIESGRVEVEVEQVDVADTITAVLRLVDGRARERGVHLRTEPAPGLPALLGDEGHLKQILINLLSNAVKFTPEGGTVVVRAGLQADDLVIAVEDSGIGIAPEAIPKVLEPFVQADGGLSRRFGGTGLGLPLARRLTELQGGSLELDSTPGAGTTVRLRFPAEHLATRTDEVIGVVRHFR
jgi:signal transduction histidine kinase